MSPDDRVIDFIFFDIGGTLGELAPATGDLVPFPSSAGLLTAVKAAIGVRVGVITTLGRLSNAEGKALLEHAGLAGFLDPHGFVSEHDAGGTAKPAPAIYRFAAEAVGVPVGRCLFVGENLVEVLGAKAAGMQAVLKPCPPGRELPH